MITYESQALIPVAFILGFYINIVFARFWTYFCAIPWGLKLSMALVANIPGTDERPRLIRRTCVRYVLGSLIITCTRLNLVAKKRFPNPEHFASSGIFTEEECAIIFDAKPTHFQPFIPILWATSIVSLAERERLIKNRHSLSLIINEINNFRQGLLDLFMMDHVCVPLVYTQVVTLAVYSYVVASLIGRQYIVHSSPLIDKLGVKDLYFPFFTLIELCIYLGWLKVAETLVNSMGEDDEDIDINEVIDFNWKACWNIVDGMRTSPPEMIRDMHWNQSVIELPHTEESKRLPVQELVGSVFELNVPGQTDFIGSTTSIGMRSHSNLQDLFGTKNSRLSTVRDGMKSLTASDETDKLNGLIETKIIVTTNDDEESNDANKTTELEMPSNYESQPLTKIAPETIEEVDEEYEDERSSGQQSLERQSVKSPKD